MKKNVSLIIPVYNEEGSLPKLYDALKTFIHQSKRQTQIVFINDGSTDASLEIMTTLAKNDSAILLLGSRRNRGKAHALRKGIEAASGEVMVTLDADLQDDPAEISKLLDKIDEGHDLVVGWRKRRNDKVDKRLPSFIYNRITRLLSGVNLHDFNSGLKAFRRELAYELNLYGDFHRYIPVIAAAKGFSVTEVPVTHHPRQYGKSKYGFSRIPKSFFDFMSILFITRFSNHPLHLFGAIGMISFVIGCVLLGYLSYIHFQGISIGRRPLLNLGILLIIAGIQFVSTGLVAELITSYFKETRHEHSHDSEDKNT